MLVIYCIPKLLLILQPNTCPMNSQSLSRFTAAARITLFFVYAVILAGAIVRATGSGMGCPDWPKCFGHYIPPTDRAQLEYQEGKQFKKGNFIIWNDALYKAKRDVTAAGEVNESDWERYTKHDYAKFNVYHTWTEYVNRLMGALLGMAAFIMFILSFRFRASDKLMIVLSGAAVFLIGFEAWLGAKVVDSNLAPVKITTHMIVAFVILALVIWIIRRAAGKTGAQPVMVPGAVKVLLVIALLASLLQTVFGTQVREEVDVISKAMDDQNRDLWVEQLGAFFNVHRLFALVVLFVNALLVWLIYRNVQPTVSLRRKGIFLITLLVIELTAGTILANFGFPSAFQPVHLFLAAAIFGLQFNMLMEAK